MWQLLGFGPVDTPERRYAVVDDTGAVQWAGDHVYDAMAFIMAHGLAHRMEHTPEGSPFVRERDPPEDGNTAFLPHGH